MEKKIGDNGPSGVFIANVGSSKIYGGGPSACFAPDCFHVYRNGADGHKPIRDHQIFETLLEACAWATVHP